MSKILRDISLRDFGASLNTVESYTNESSQGKIGLCETVNKQKCTHLGMFLASDIYELTHGQVSIMQDANTYKDIYTILDDISKVWDSLTDKEHATLTETLFGKHRANIGSAIISNFEQARKAIETMENADGGAMAEMEVIMDSISYKTNTFKETLVGIAQNSFSQDFLKSMVDSGTRVLNVFDDLSPSISFILEKFASLLELVT